MERTSLIIEFARTLVRRRLTIFSVALFAGTLGAFLIRSHWVQQLRAAANHNRAVERLIGQQMEPNRSEEYPVVVAATIGSARTHSECDPLGGSGESACDTVAALHSGARALAARLDTLGEEPSGDDSTFTDALASIQLAYRSRLPQVRELDDAWWQRWTEESAAMLSVIVQGRGIPIQACRYPDNAPPSRLEATTRSYERTFGVPGCDKEPQRFHAQLLVPSRLRLGYAPDEARPNERAAGCGGLHPRLEPPAPSNPAARRAAPRGRRARRADRAAAAPDPPPVETRAFQCPSSYSDRVHQHAALSLIVEILLRPLLAAAAHRPTGSDPPESGTATDSEFVQAYFVSEDGILRIWSRDQTTLPFEYLSGRTVWSTAQYIGRLVENDDTSGSGPTVPYLDHGGYGFVRTRCTAIRDGRGAVIGGFCTDRTEPSLALNAVADRLRQSAAEGSQPFRVLWGRVTRQYDGHVTVNMLAPDTALATFAESMDLGADSLNQAQREIGSQISSIAEAAFATGRGLKQVMTFQAYGEDLHFVPLRAAGSDGVTSVEWLLIRARVTEPSTVSLYGGFILLLLAVAAAVWVIVRSRVEARRRQEDAILQNLQVGVVSGPLLENMDTELEAANDRAEELLGVPLSAFGAEDITREKFLHCVDAKTVIRAVRVRNNLAEFIPGEPVDPERIADERRHGHSSEYFVRTAKTPMETPTDTHGAPSGRRWLLVRGSPFISDDTRLRGPGGSVRVRTFAVVEPVSNDLAGKCERILDKEKRAAPAAPASSAAVPLAATAVVGGAADIAVADGEEAGDGG